MAVKMAAHSVDTKEESAVYRSAQKTVEKMAASMVELMAAMKVYKKGDKWAV